MLFGYLTLFTALILSLSAAVYSILGLTAIFAAAFWPIVILGGSLEIGKIVTTLWLHKYWTRAELQYKLYLCSAVVILMVLTSMGVFGFLSKAHLDQAVPSGDIQAQVQIFDDKIQTQKDNIKTARAALTQMDTAVDQVMGRSQDEKGADKAVAIRRSQARERTALQNDISKAQTEITRLQEGRAPIASQARKVEAEVGPIKYIAALLYGDNPDANILEKAVRYVIILIVVVFDPLALTLLLAATKTFEWEHDIDLFNNKKPDDKEPVEEEETVESWFARAKNRARFWDQQNNPDPNKAIDESQYWISDIEEVEPIFDRETDIPDYEQDDGPLTDEQVKHIRELAKDELPTGEVITKESLFADPSSPGWMFVDKLRPGEVVEEVDPLANIVVPIIDRNEDPLHHMAKVMWHAANPDDDHRIHHALHQAGEIDRLPWHTADHINSLAISDGERKQLIDRFANAPPLPRPTPPAPKPLPAPPSGDGNLWVPQDGGWVNAGPITQFDFGDLGLEADNVPTQSGEVKGFGTQFPATPNKGDMFLRVDHLPSMLYKFNGNLWIEVDKALTDGHAYDVAYIDHLISKIESGEYDPDLLSDAERDSIERRLNNTPRGV